MVIKIFGFFVLTINILLFVIYLSTIFLKKTYNYNMIIIFNILILNNIFLFILYIKKTINKLKHIKNS